MIISNASGNAHEDGFIDDISDPEGLEETWVHDGKWMSL